MGDVMTDTQLQFLKELRDLLGRYNVELTAEDHWTGYAECGEDVRITANFNDFRVKDLDLGDSFSATYTNGKL